MFLKASGIIDRLDEMIESAIDGSFEEKNYSESRLSKLEAKLYRYLASGCTARKQIAAERDAIKTLVSDISHQTKTPLANMLLYTELLKEKELSEESAQLVSAIGQQTEKLNFLIQALVKLSRLENGTIELQPEQRGIQELLEGMDYASRAEEKEITCEIVRGEEITALFDAKWTAEALDNILDNAFKYTPCGGRVTVSASGYELFARIDIADTGIGIREEECAKIFQRFYRSPAVREEKGVGIGLYLSRKIIEGQGGYIKVSSGAGKGSVFSVFLPKPGNLSKL